MSKDDFIKALKSKKTLLLVGVTALIGWIGISAELKRRENVKEQEFLDLVSAIEAKKSTGVSIVLLLIDLGEAVQKFHSYKERSDDFIYKAADSQIKFKELARNFNRYPGEVAMRAEAIAEFYADHCEQKIFFHAKVKEAMLTTTINNSKAISFADELARNAQDSARADKFQQDLQIVFRIFVNEYKGYFNDEQKAAVCSLLLDKFKPDIDEYYKKLKKSGGEANIKMLASQWPQIILYKEMSESGSE